MSECGGIASYMLAYLKFLYAVDLENQ